MLDHVCFGPGGLSGQQVPSVPCRRRSVTARVQAVAPSSKEQIAVCHVHLDLPNHAGLGHPPTIHQRTAAPCDSIGHRINSPGTNGSAGDAVGPDTSHVSPRPFPHPHLARVHLRTQEPGQALRELVTRLNSSITSTPWPTPCHFLHLCSSLQVTHTQSLTSVKRPPSQDPMVNEQHACFQLCPLQKHPSVHHPMALRLQRLLLLLYHQDHCERGKDDAAHQNSHWIAAASAACFFYYPHPKRLRFHDVVAVLIISSIVSLSLFISFDCNAA